MQLGFMIGCNDLVIMNEYECGQKNAETIKYEKKCRKRPIMCD
jgi:hypothetical protein